MADVKTDDVDSIHTQQDVTFHVWHNISTVHRFCILSYAFGLDYTSQA